MKHIRLNYHELKVGDGLTLLQINPEVAIDLKGSQSETHGYLFDKNENDEWIKMRKATSSEMEDAYDQSNAFEVLDAAATPEVTPKPSVLKRIFE